MLIRSLSCLAAALIIAGCSDPAETNDEADGVTDDPTISIFDLGAQNSQTPFGFEIGTSALGFTIYSQFPLHAGFETIWSPNNDMVVEESSIPGTAAMFRAYPTFAVVPAPYDVLATIPQSDASAAMPLSPGLWQVALRDQIGLAVEVPNVRVLVRHTNDGTFQGGIIDVNVFLTPNSADDQQFRQAVEQAFSSFAGISMGDIRFYDMDQSASIVDDEEEFRSILRGLAGSVEKTPALNIVVVQDMSKLFAAAKAGGTPGLTLWHGTYVSGLVMEASQDVTLDALTLAHEAGHLAGLFHTTEKLNPLTDTLTDALDDTLSCTDPLLLDQCPDAGNLMFPLPTGSWSAALSAKQKTVIQGSTFYRFAHNEQPTANPQGHEHHGTTIVSEQLTRFHKRWRSRLESFSPAARTALLQFCGSGAQGQAIFTPTRLEQKALFSVAIGADVPNYVRKRAMMLASRPGLTATQRASLSEVVLQQSAPPAARVGALHGLQQSDPKAAYTLALKLLEREQEVRVADAAQALINAE